MVCILFFSCKKKESKTEPVVAPSTTSSTTPTSGLDQNTALNVKFTVSIPSASYSTVNYSFTPSLSSESGSYYGPYIGYPYRYYSSIFSVYNNTSSPTLSIFKRDTILRTFTTFNDSVFISLFKTANYKYASTQDVGSVNNFGVELSFKDNAGINWSTLKAYPSVSYQSITSSFSITEVVNYLTSGNTPTRAVKYKANFGCKLYSTSGDSIYISNGEIIGSARKY